MQTLSEWDRLCKLFASDYKTSTVCEYVQHPKSVDLIIKHDVESEAPRALEIAKIEHKYGLKATYYFQADIVISHPEIVKTIFALGHEVGYHYDVMDAQHGNLILAIDEFKFNLGIFEGVGCKVETVCPHGNPMMQRDGWTSNKDFFREKDVQNLFPEITDIIIMAKKMFGGELGYVTDAGYSWKLVAAIDENDRVDSKDTELNELCPFLSSTECKPVIISSHPHRWQDSQIRAFYQKFIFKCLRTSAQVLSNIPFVYKFISRFYYVARRF